LVTNAPECRLASSGQDQIPTLPQLWVHVPLYVFTTSGVAVGIAAGVGSAVLAFLLAIMNVLTLTASIAVVKCGKRKGECECHFRITSFVTG